MIIGDRGREITDNNPIGPFKEPFLEMIIQKKSLKREILMFKISHYKLWNIACSVCLYFNKSNSIRTVS